MASPNMIPDALNLTLDIEACREVGCRTGMGI